MQRVWLVLFAAGAAVGTNWWLFHSRVAAESDSPSQVNYHRDVWPVIEKNCLRCHSPKKKQGALDMSTRESLLKGGHSGPAFVPGNVDKSLMVELIDFDEMPPKREKPRVTKEQLATIRAWIAAGAPVPAEK